MANLIDWRKLREEGQAISEKRFREAANKSSINRDFYGAALIAMDSAQKDNLYPALDESGNYTYNVQQGLKAACHSREDVTSILIIQKALLTRLQELRIITLACLASIIYIAIRVS